MTDLVGEPSGQLLNPDSEPSRQQAGEGHYWQTQTDGGPRQTQPEQADNSKRQPSQPRRKATQTDSSPDPDSKPSNLEQTGTQ